MDVSAIRPFDPTTTAARPVAPAATEAAGAAAAAGSPGFGDWIARYAQDVNGLQQQANEAVSALATGKIDNVHQVVMALGKAEVSFKLMMEVRNKVLDAYRDIMRMPM